MVKIGVLAFAVLSAALSATAQQTVWGQCGGIGWTGPTTCASGSTCVKQNDYYSQCLPGAASTTPVAPTPTPTPTPTTVRPPASTTTANPGSSATCPSLRRTKH